jgi:hypothetical protein
LKFLLTATDLLPEITIEKKCSFSQKNFVESIYCTKLEPQPHKNGLAQWLRNAGSRIVGSTGRKNYTQLMAAIIIL